MKMAKASEARPACAGHGFPSLPKDCGERFDELSAAMDVAGRDSPKYACQLILKHILSLESRINELERKPTEDEADCDG